MPDPPRTIRLVGYPVQLYARAAEHQAALQRELDVVRVNSESAATAVPPPVAELLDEFDTRFRGYAATMAVIGDLVVEGADDAEVVIPVATDPTLITPEIVRLAELLDAADDFCRSAALLTLATPPELVAFRQWVFGEVLAQLDGAEPTRWQAVDATATPETTPPFDRSVYPDDLPDGWSMATTGRGAVVVATGALDLTTAGALRGMLHSLVAAAPERVVVDLTRIGFIDSVGLSVVVAAHVRFEHSGARLHVRIPDRLHRLFEIAGLLAILDVETVPPA